MSLEKKESRLQAEINDVLLCSVSLDSSWRNAQRNQSLFLKELSLPTMESQWLLL